MVVASRRRRPQSGHVRHAASADRFSLATSAAPPPPAAPQASTALFSMTPAGRRARARGESDDVGADFGASPPALPPVALAASDFLGRDSDRAPFAFGGLWVGTRGDDARGTCFLQRLVATGLRGFLEPPSQRSRSRRLISFRLAHLFITLLTLPLNIQS